MNMLKRLALLTVISFLYIESGLTQIVSFTTDRTECNIGDVIICYNTSNILFKDSVFIWNFGDDCGKSLVFSNNDCDIKTKGSVSMKHSYNKPGRYIITLKIAGSDRFFQKEIIVTAINHPLNKQNSVITEYIQNGNFEQATCIPTTPGQLGFASPWYSPTSGTSDLFSRNFDSTLTYDFNMGIPINFAGYADDPHQEFSYCGIIAYITGFDSLEYDSNNIFAEYREYLQQELLDTLTAGKKYLVSFKYRLSSLSRYATRLGVALTNYAPLSSSTENLLIAPSMETDAEDNTDSWHTFSDTIIAAGNERFITIGNFRNDSAQNIVDQNPNNIISSVYGGFSAQAAYYYVDNVIVTLVKEDFEDRHVIVSSGGYFQNDSLFVEFSVGQRISNTYINNTASSCLTQGVLQPQSDDPSEKKTMNNKHFSFECFPNPTDGLVTINLRNSGTSPYYLIRVFDAGGNLCLSETHFVHDNIHKYNFSLNISRQVSGKYIILISDKNCYTANSTIIKIK